MTAIVLSLTKGYNFLSSQICRWKGLWFLINKGIWCVYYFMVDAFTFLGQLIKIEIYCDPFSSPISINNYFLGKCNWFFLMYLSLFHCTSIFFKHLQGSIGQPKVVAVGQSGLLNSLQSASVIPPMVQPPSQTFSTSTNSRDNSF